MNYGANSKRVMKNSPLEIGIVGKSTMSGKIFINYRRDDDAGFSTALYIILEGEFGPDQLFMDVEGHIKPGDDFIKVIQMQVAQCDVLLAIIGPRWAELLIARANDVDDFVVIEIKAALDQGKRVIPVLVGGAVFPSAANLPETVRHLAYRNAVGLRRDRFKADCLGLSIALKGALAAAEAERVVEELKKRSSTLEDPTDSLRRQDEALAAAKRAASLYEEELSRLRSDLEKNSADRSGRRFRRPSKWSLDDYRAEYDRLNLENSKLREQIARGKRQK